MGTVEMIILFLLDKKDLYGYEITSLVEKLSEGNIGITEVHFILLFISFLETNIYLTKKYRLEKDVQEYIIISKHQVRNIWKSCLQSITKILQAYAKFLLALLLMIIKITTKYIYENKGAVPCIVSGFNMTGAARDSSFNYHSSLSLNTLFNSIYCFKCSLNGTSDLNWKNQ